MNIYVSASLECYGSWVFVIKTLYFVVLSFLTQIYFLWCCVYFSCLSHTCLLGCFLMLPSNGSVPLYAYSFHSILITFPFSFCIFWNAVAEWANDALQGLGKGAPFSLFLTEKHFSQVASAQGNSGSLLSTVSFLTFHLDQLQFVWSWLLYIRTLNA